MRFYTKLSLGFFAGALGGFVSALVLWFLVHFGVAQSVGIHIDLPLSFYGKETLPYQQIVWGGVFGLLLLLPLLKDGWFLRGLAMSLVPTAIVLFYLLPYRLDAGMCGIDLGALTFALVLLVNGFWGVIAAAWYQATAK